MRREDIVVEKWRLDRMPMILGKKFLLLTSWQRNKIDESRIEKELLIIDPGLALSPYHATIDLAIRMLEDCWSGGRFLDAGTGSGVIALAAARLANGAINSAIIDAVESDPDLIDYIGQTLILNSLEKVINLRPGRLNDYIGGQYTHIAINLLSPIATEPLDLLLAKLSQCLKGKGRLMISGVNELRSQKYKISWGWGDCLIECPGRSQLIDALSRAGLVVLDCLSAPPWCALSVESPDNI